MKCVEYVSIKIMLLVPLKHITENDLWCNMSWIYTIKHVHDLLVTIIGDYFHFRVVRSFFHWIISDK
jgi:hypothetical protein